MRRLLLLLPLLLLACGTDDAAGSCDALVPTAGPVGDLVVEQDAGDGSPPRRWPLVCGDPVGTDGSDHPAAEAACAHLVEMDDPFRPLDPDAMCTQQFGGPQTAVVTGTWLGEPVDLRLSRSDGCAISQWDSLGPLLPGPVGVELPEEQPQ